MSVWREQVENDFVKNINDTYTLNLAISILEDREDFRKEIERLNKSFDNLENVIRYYVIGNSKYDDITAEYILNRLLQFRVKGSDKE